MRNQLHNYLMMKDFLTEIEYVGFTSRLKRLSDSILYSTKDLYKSEGLDIEPNWNLIFRLLQENQEMTISEMSETLQFSHPAVVKIVNKMKKHGYLRSSSDRADKRRQPLRLTKKAHKKLAQFEIYWKAGTEAIKEVLQDSPHFLEELLRIEEKMRQSNYQERTLKKLQQYEDSH